MKSVLPSAENVLLRNAAGTFDPTLLATPRPPISLGLLETREAATKLYAPVGDEQEFYTESGKHDATLEEIIAGGNPLTAGLARATRQFLTAYGPPDMQKPKVYSFVRFGRNYNRPARHFDGFGDLIVFTASQVGPAIYDPSPYAEEAQRRLRQEHKSTEGHLLMEKMLNEIMPPDAPTVPVEPWEILVGDKHTFHETPAVDPSAWRIFGRLSLYFS